MKAFEAEAIMEAIAVILPQSGNVVSLHTGLSGAYDKGIDECLQMCMAVLQCENRRQLQAVLLGCAIPPSVAAIYVAGVDSWKEYLLNPPKTEAQVVQSIKDALPQSELKPLLSSLVDLVDARKAFAELTAFVDMDFRGFISVLRERTKVPPEARKMIADKVLSASNVTDSLVAIVCQGVVAYVCLEIAKTETHWYRGARTA